MVTTWSAGDKTVTGNFLYWNNVKKSIQEEFGLRLNVDISINRLISTGRESPQSRFTTQALKGRENTFITDPQNMVEVTWQVGEKAVTHNLTTK